jgi:hypothetical protein
MGSNGLDLTTNMNCDVEISHGADVFGYLMRANTKLQERRGNAFAGAVASGAPTYQTASPFSRAPWETFGGGIGQEQQDRMIGGPAGQGGDPSRHYYSNAWTGKGNLLLPGMARTLTPPSPSAKYDPTTEMEQPRGEIPCTHPAGAYNAWTSTGSRTVGVIRLLCWFYKPKATNIVVTATLDGTHTYQSDPINDPYNYHLFKWVTLKKVGGGTATLNAGFHYLRANYNASVAYGCYPGNTLATDGVTVLTDVLLCYAQFSSATTNAASSYNLSDRIRETEIVIGVNTNGVDTNSHMTFTDTTCFNGGDQYSIGNTVAEHTLGGTYSGSIVYDNKVFAGTTGAGANRKTSYWSVANSRGVPPDGTNTTFALGKACIHEKLIYFVDGEDGATIKKWDASNIANAPTTIINAGSIGSPDSDGKNRINNIFIHKGLLYVIKPDGVFMIYADPSKIVSTTKPRVLKVWGPNTLYSRDVGYHCVEHQGAVFFGCRELVVRFAVTEQGSEITYLPLPPVLGRIPNKFFYVNGLTTGGDLLYVSYNNVGVFAWTNGSWHFVAHFFEQQLADDTVSGLTYCPQAGLDQDLLIFGDNRQQIIMPVPNTRVSYASHINLYEQNKAFWFCTSFWDADLANLKKTLKAITLRAAPNGWNYKVIGAFYQTTDDEAATSRTIIEKSLVAAMHRDYWTNPTAPAAGAGTYPTITKKILSTATGLPTTTDAPCYYTASEFNNAFMSVTKDVTPDHVDRPVQAVNVVFIIIGWKANGVQYTGAEQHEDYTYIESMVLEYLPTQERIAVYSLMLDLHALTRDPANPLDETELEETIEFLRERCRAETPTRFKIRDRQTNTVKTVIGFIQNDSWTDRPNREAKDDVTVADVVQFTILSIEPDTA